MGRVRQQSNGVFHEEKNKGSVYIIYLLDHSFIGLHIFVARGETSFWFGVDDGNVLSGQHCWCSFFFLYVQAMCIFTEYIFTDECCFSTYFSSS